MTTREISLTIDSELPSIALVGAAVRGISQLAGFDESASYNMELCVVEAVTNSVQHAYGNRRGSEVEIRLRLDPETFLIEVRDHGEISGELSAPEEPEITTSDNIDIDIASVSLRGRGLFLMRKLMDEVRFEGGEEGNVVIMTKTLSPLTG